MVRSENVCGQQRVAPRWRLLLTLLASLLLVPFGRADAQWTAALTISPRPSPFLSDWQTAPGQGEFILTHATGPAEQIRFRFRLEREGRQVATGTGSPLTFAAGPSSRSFRTHNAVDWNGLSFDEALRGSVRANGRFPEGRYRACITVLGANNAQLAEACASFTIDALQRPTLVAPTRDDSVRTAQPLFTWQWNAGALGERNRRFKLVIVEVPAGKQPLQAIASARPHYSAVVAATSHVYPASGLPLQAGKRYAWQVTVADASGKPLNDPNAASDVWSFLGPASKLLIKGKILEPKDSAKVPGGKKIPKSYVSGRIVWGFPNGTQKGFPPVYPYANGKVKVYAPLLNGKLKVVATGTTDEEGNFQMKYTDPNKVGKLQVEEKQGHTRDLTFVVVGVDNPYMTMPKPTVMLSRDSAGSYDLGTIAAQAVTFELKPTVREMGEGGTIKNATIEIFRPYNFYRGQDGKHFSRHEGTVPEDDREIETISNNGDGPDWSSPVVRIASGKQDERFTRLVPALGPNDRYYIRVSAPGYQTLKYEASFNPKNANGPDGWPIKAQVIELGRRKPIVEGRVVYRTTQAPLEGATVRLTKKGQGTEPEVGVTTTDATGKFSIQDITPSEHIPFILRVKYAKRILYVDTLTLDELGDKITLDPVQVDGQEVTIYGVVRDDKGKAVPDAQVRLRAGQPVYTDKSGGFFLTGYPGSDSLIVTKFGYRDSREPLEVKDATTKFLGKDVEHLMVIGEVVLQPRVGRLLVTVVDNATNEPIAGATVDVADSGALATTKDNGQAYLGKAPGGSVPVLVRGPADAAYVPQKSTVKISEKGDTTSITVKLKMGATATGRVTANGQKVSGARVRVDGRDDLETFTDNSGEYTLRGVPPGQTTLKATKQGLAGATQKKSFTASQETTVDFTLQSGPGGADLSTLLGFAVEIDEAKEQGSEIILTGAFIKVKNNALFKAPGDLRIPFHNIRATASGGVLRPKGDTVLTDATEMGGNAFTYLAVRMKSAKGITVRMRNGDPKLGRISGRLSIDYGKTWASLAGVKWGEGVIDDYIAPKVPEFKTMPDWTTMYTSDGSAPLPDVDSLKLGAAGKRTITLYGYPVDLDLSNSSVKLNGLHIRGTVDIPKVPMLNVDQLRLGELWIGTDGKVKDVDFSLSPKPKIDIAGWGVQLAKIALGEAGFRWDGSITMKIPASPDAVVAFKELQIGGDQLFGGTFTLPNDGVSIFGAVKFEGVKDKPIGIGRVPGKNTYFVAGGGVFSLPKYIEKKLTVTDFRVQTDGKIAATVATNFKSSFFGLAEIAVTGLGIDATAKTPKVTVDGAITLTAIPYITPTASGIHYQPGGKVTVDNIGLSFDLKSVAHAEVNIAIKENGFSGTGSFEVKSAPIGAEISFHYFKVQGGVDFGAEFMAKTPPIPIGPVTINKIGGGFAYNSATKYYKVTLKGAVAFANENALALDPLEVSIESGPIIKGHASCKVLTQDVGQVDLLIDVPHKLFDITATFKPQFMKKVNCEAEASIKLALGEDNGKAFFFFGTYLKAKLAGLFEANVNFTFGINATASKYGKFTDFIPTKFLTSDGRVYGVHVDAHVLVGRKKNDPWQKHWGKTYVTYWAYNETWATLHFRFKNAAFNIEIGNEMGAGAIVTRNGHTLISIDVGIKGVLGGGYNDVDGWNLYGEFAAWFKAYVGDCNVCRWLTTCWEKQGCCTYKWRGFAIACVDFSLKGSYGSERSPKWKWDIDW